MMKIMKKLFAVFFVTVFLLSASVPAFATENTDSASSSFSDGLSFSSLGTYPVTKSYRGSPRTFEAVIYVPAELTERAGVMLGNKQAESGDAYLTFEIFKDGVPRLSYMDVWGIAYDFRFTSVDVRTDGWVHLSIVCDADAGEVRCYLNGILAEVQNVDATEKPFSDYHADSAENPFFIGGDGSERNEKFFKGAIKSLAVFDRARSEEEIASDAAGGVDVADESLLALYNMEGLLGSEDILDLSINMAHATCQREWFDDSTGAYAGEYDFSLAVIGDTQNLIWREAAGQSGYVGATAALYSWIVDRVGSKKIQYVLGLGDIVDNDFDSEWEVAKNAIVQMDGEVPYSLIRGQGHDTATKFNQYFAEHTPFTENIGGTFKEGSVANTWQTFSFGDEDYLIFGFDFGAPDDVLAWADGVVAAHPNHRIIVTTHAYLDKDGTTLDRGEVANATGYDDDVKYHEDPEKYVPDGRDSAAEFNDGKSIWQKFASKHENVFMVISGHVITEDVVINQREGVHGNTVTEILIDAQGMDDGQYDGGVGMVSMFYFDLEQNRVAIEYYSTVQKAYRRLNVIDLDHKHVFEDVLIPSTCKDVGYQVSVCACGKEAKRIVLPRKREHTYDSNSDVACNVCGKIREIETEEESIEEVTAVDSTESESTAENEMPVESIPEIDSEGVTESEPTAENEMPAESIPEIDSEGVAETEAESSPMSEESTFDESVDNEQEDTDDRTPLYAIVAVSLGAVALLVGGIAVWHFRSERKKK